jgi:hypothetical protein
VRPTPSSSSAAATSSIALSASTSSTIGIGATGLLLSVAEEMRVAAGNKSATLPSQVRSRAICVLSAFLKCKGSITHAFSMCRLDVQYITRSICRLLTDRIVDRRDPKYNHILLIGSGLHSNFKFARNDRNDDPRP